MESQASLRWKTAAGGHLRKLSRQSSEHCGVQTRPTVAGSEDGERGQELRNVAEPLKTGKGNGSAPKASRNVLLTPYFEPSVTCVKTPHLRNCRKICAVLQVNKWQRWDCDRVVRGFFKEVTFQLSPGNC